jgi:pimeloyl-ACP methyl ester carboxylesterase
MGGNIALELAAEYPQLVSGIVLLDSAFLYSKDALEMIGFYADEIEKDNKACIEKLLNNCCLKTDTCAPFLESMYLETSPSVWRSCFLEMIRWDKDKVKDQIKKIHIPILYIEAENCIIDMPAFKELYPGLMTAKVVSSGHLLSLEVPEQINPMIERFSLTALH